MLRLVKYGTTRTLPRLMKRLSIHVAVELSCFISQGRVKYPPPLIIQCFPPLDWVFQHMSTKGEGGKIANFDLHLFSMR